MLRVRMATVDDVPVITQLIAELAAYEKQADQVRTTEADISRDGFGPHPEFRVLIAEWQGVPAGFAIFFGYYSTWRGTGLYLEDLFVRPEFRRLGIATALLARVSRTAEREKRAFVRWAVLDWNQSAIALYRGLGADFMVEWQTVLLAGEPLKKLAEHSPSGLRDTALSRRSELLE